MMFSLFISIFFCTFFVAQSSGSQEASIDKLINNTQPSGSINNNILTSLNGSVQNIAQNVEEQMPRNTTQELTPPTVSNSLSNEISSNAIQSSSTHTSTSSTQKSSENNKIPSSSPTTQNVSNTKASYPLPLSNAANNSKRFSHKEFNTIIPDSILTLRIPGGESEFIYHDVGENATNILGTYFVNSLDANAQINFTIIDPNQTRVFHENSENKGYFSITTYLPGTYSFKFSNAAWKSTKYIRIGFSIRNHDLLKKEDVKTFNDHLDSILKTTKEIHSESQHIWGRQRAQMFRVEQSSNWIFWLSLFELFMMFAIVAFELRFLKLLVSNRCLF